jgi:hypothetical protein
LQFKNVEQTIFSNPDNDIFFKMYYFKR